MHERQGNIAYPLKIAYTFTGSPEVGQVAASTCEACIRYGNAWEIGTKEHTCKLIFVVEKFGDQPEDYMIGFADGSPTDYRLLSYLAERAICSADYYARNLPTPKIMGLCDSPVVHTEKGVVLSAFATILLLELLERSKSAVIEK